jgi:hypothetical protein
MRPLALLIALSLAAGAPGASAQDGAIATHQPEADRPGGQEASTAEARYQLLLSRAKASAPDADWAALRSAYAARPGFRVLAQAPAKRAMFEAVEKKDCAAALPAARAVIDEAFVDPDAHLVAAYCEDQAGDKASAQIDRDIGAGLLKSIETGDGLSPAHPFKPITVDEEYAVMRGLGLKVTAQALVHQDGHAYDALSALDASGKSATYYFLIDQLLAAEAAELKPGDVSEGGPPSRTP